jgi:hypothetical protein
MNLQTLVFNTTFKTVKVYETEKYSKILYEFDNVPTVKVKEDGHYYEVIQKGPDMMSSEERSTPIARFPIANTNMLIEK